MNILTWIGWKLILISKLILKSYEIGHWSISLFGELFWFLMQDLRHIVLHLQELIEKRQAMIDEFTKYLARLEEQWVEEKPIRLELRDGKKKRIGLMLASVKAMYLYLGTVQRILVLFVCPFSH